MKDSDYVVPAIVLVCCGILALGIFAVFMRWRKKRAERDAEFTRKFADPDPAALTNARPETTEAQSILKLELECSKLRLETRSLSKQLSWQGSLIEWLKATAVPVTLLGAILAFFVGFGQLRQSEQNRVADRFDKTLTRLASKNPIERITGVSGMCLFVMSDAKSLQGPSIQSLVDAMAYEDEERVANRIIDVLSDLRKGQLSQEVVNDALLLAVEHNRSLTQLILHNSEYQIQQNQKRRLAELPGLRLTADKIPSPIPAALLHRLSVQEYLGHLDEEHDPFRQLDNSERIPLNGLTQVIGTLIALGAKVDDLSRIYCEECDFTTAGDLSGAKFDGAFLFGANFSKVTLKGASFRDADLGSTSFYGADLRGADLRSNVAVQSTSGYHGSVQFPLLECARLEGANMDGLVLLVIEKTFAIIWAGERALRIVSPKVLSAAIDGSTRLDEFGVIVITSISDSYLKEHPKDGIVHSFLEDRERFGGDELFGSGWSQYPIVRHHGYFATDAASYTDTAFVQRKDIRKEQLEGFDDEEIAILQTYLNQPALKAFPIIAKILELKGTKPSQPASAQLKWNLGTPDACTGNKRPRREALILDSGTQSLTVRSKLSHRDH